MSCGRPVVSVGLSAPAGISSGPDCLGLPHAVSTSATARNRPTTKLHFLSIFFSIHLVCTQQRQINKGLVRTNTLGGQTATINAGGRLNIHLYGMIASGAVRAHTTFLLNLQRATAVGRSNTYGVASWLGKPIVSPLHPREWAQRRRS